MTDRKKPQRFTYLQPWIDQLMLESVKDFETISEWIEGAILLRLGEEHPECRATYQARELARSAREAVANAGR